MTLTLIGPAPDAITTTDALEAPRTTAHVLLALLRDMVTACVDLDPDLLHSTRPGGRAVLLITAAARSCANDLGEDAGTPLTEAPGIVVLRDLVRLLALLESTIATGAVLDDPGTDLPLELADAYATFLKTVGSQA